MPSKSNECVKDFEIINKEGTDGKVIFLAVPAHAKASKNFFLNLKNIAEWLKLIVLIKTFYLLAMEP